MNASIRVIAVSLLSLAALAGCSSKAVKEEAPAPAPTPAPVAPPPPVADTGKYGPGDLDTDPNLRQRVIYFDFDKDVVRPEFQAVLAAHAKYLVDRPSARITLEGHADERGTREYNLGLGERRGNSVSSTLQANGGSGSQLTVVSYGKERPAVLGSNEEAWAKNRRVELIYTTK